MERVMDSMAPKAPVWQTAEGLRLNRLGKPAVPGWRVLIAPVSRPIPCKQGILQGISQKLGPIGGAAIQETPDPLALL